MNTLDKGRMRHTLSENEKLCVIRDHAKGNSYRKLAEMYSCSKAQIQKIMSANKKFAAECNSFEAERTIKKQARMVILEAAVNEWIQRSRRHGHLIDDSKICNISLLISKLINFDDFEPKNLWLQFFKQKFKIVSLGPLTTNGFFNASLNIVDILIDMMKAKTDLGFPLLWEHIKEQLEVSCASAAQAACRGKINEGSGNKEPGDRRGENNQNCDLGPLFGYQANSVEAIKIEETDDRSSQNYEIQKALELDGFCINENDERYINIDEPQASIVLDLKDNETDLQKTNTIALELIENFDIDIYREGSSEEFGPHPDTSIVLDLGEDEADTIKIEVIFDENNGDKEGVPENDLRPPDSDSYQKTTKGDILVLNEEEDLTEKDKSQLGCPITNPNMNNVESEDTSSSKIETQEENAISVINQAKFKPIISYKDAMKRLGPLGDFVFTHKNIRAAAIINQLEKIFMERVKLNE